MKKNVKSILFRMELKGRGIVNFDSSNQKYLWNENTKNTGQERINHNNTSFAKKRWYKNNDGSFNHKIIISSDCLRHNIFSDDMLYQSANIINHTNLLYSMVASPTLVLRGYFYPSKDPSLALKRKSVLNITEAEQTNNSFSSIETFSRSGEKLIDENKSDTSFFKKETIGEIIYESIGSIDLMQLQFISCDQLFDRLAMNPDYFEIYSKLLSARLPNFNSKLSYYQIKNSVVELPEYGLVFSNENIIYMVKEQFKRLLCLNIRTATAYAETTKIQYKLVSDPFEDKFNNNEGWVDLTEEIINSMDFEVNNFYTEYDFDKAKELRLELEEKANAIKEINKEEAKVKKEKTKKGNKEGESSEDISDN